MRISDWSSDVCSSDLRIEGRRLFNLVCKLPSGIGKQKALRGLAVPDAIAEGARRSLPTISAKTINASYMTFLSAMFGWAVREGWMAHNPVARLRVGERAAPEGKRAPFSNEQLPAIFSEPPWSPRDATGADDRAP